MRRVCESILLWKSNKYYIFVCVCLCARARAFWRVPGRVGVCICVHAHRLAYPAYEAYAPCCDVICGRSGLHHIFRHLINGTIFGKKKKLLNTKSVFRFSLQLLSKVFLILRKI
jgi:hypothetical protein